MPPFFVDVIINKHPKEEAMQTWKRNPNDEVAMIAAAMV